MQSASTRSWGFHLSGSKLALLKRADAQGDPMSGFVALKLCFARLSSAVRFAQ